MADLKAQLEISADASGVEAGITKAKRSLATLGETAKREGAKAAEGLEGIGEGGTSASAKVDTATRNMIGSIQRTTAALEAGSRTGSKYFETLAAQRGVNVDALRPYLDQLDAVAAKQKTATAALAASSPTLQKVGISAAQTAAALRGVPAQFTDIVTSLQGGQAPLTVFLQQGGQLKDMFGGLGPAARALGGYVVGLVNPLTLAAAAAAALGVAYFQGSRESDNFAKALILSGNATGTTVGQLNEMAKAIDRVTGTQAGAAEALAQFAADGNVASTNIERFTTVALKLEKEAGQAVKDTVKQFAELAKDPVSASIKLNETTRFLTATVYDQIKALEEQGRTADAAAVAQAAYADTLDSRLGTLTNRLGVFQRAWRMLGSDAKDAWDLMLGIGRADTLQEKVSAAQVELGKRMERGALNSTTGDAYEKGNQALRERVATMQESIKLENRAADAQRAAAEQVKNRIAFDKEAEKYQTKAVRRAEELARANVLADKAGASAAERAKVIAGIEEKYKDKKVASTARVDGAAQANLDIADIKARAAELTNTLANTERVLEAQRSAGLINETAYYSEKKRLLAANVAAQTDALTAENARLSKDKLNTKDGLDRDRKILENQQRLSKLTADASTAQTVLELQEAAAMRTRASALLSARQAAQDYFDTLNKQQEREAQGYGKGNAKRNIEAGVSQIEDRYSGQRRDLDNNRAQLELEGKFTDESRKQYADRLAIINEFQAKSVASWLSTAARIEDSQRDWMKGLSEGLANYLDETSKIGKQVEATFTSAFQGLDEALASFVVTGKLNIKSLADSIIKDLARIAIKQNVTGPLASALSGFFGGFTGGGSVVKNANGGVYNSPGLSAYSGQVVSKPTVFPFAKGIGLMGEAGEEAILPLRRGADGKLGVSAGGGGGAPEVHIHNSGEPVAAEVQQSQNADGGMRLDVILKALKTDIAGDINSGTGQVGRAMQNRFGTKTATR